VLYIGHYLAIFCEHERLDFIDIDKLLNSTIISECDAARATLKIFWLELTRSMASINADKMFQIMIPGEIIFPNPNISHLFLKD
jgi:hypothetical protein